MKNEIGALKQGNLIISQYFLKGKKLFDELGMLDPNSCYDKNKHCRLLVHSLNKQYSTCMLAISGWTQQPTLVEWENIFINQEVLNIHMCDLTISPLKKKALFSDSKNKNEKWNNNFKNLEKGQLENRRMTKFLIKKKFINSRKIIMGVKNWTTKFKIAG